MKYAVSKIIQFHPEQSVELISCCLALNSLMGGIIALSMIITVQVSESNPYLWYLDPTVGLCVSLFLLIYGLW